MKSHFVATNLKDPQFIGELTFMERMLFVFSLVLSAIVYNNSHIQLL
jgi:hypothetical protein